MTANLSQVYTNPELDDKVVKILVDFKHKVDERDGHVDIITCKDAVRSIKDLIQEEGLRSEAR